MNNNTARSPSSSSSSSTTSLIHSSSSLSNGEERKVPLLCRGHSRPVPMLSYGPILSDDSFLLISACLDGKPMLRDGKTGDWIGTFVGHKGAVWSASLNHDATQAITASADYSCKVWNAINGSELFSFSHKRMVKCADFAMDGGRILSGGQEKLVRIFDLERPDANPIELKGHKNPIRSAYWLPQDASICSASSDSKQIRIWDVRSSKMARTLSLPAPVKGITLSDDKTLLCAASGKQVFFYSTDDYRLVKQYSVPTKQTVRAVAIHPNRRYFVTGGSDFVVRMFDYDTGKQLEMHKGHHGPVHCIKFSPDAATFGSSSEDGTIRLWLTQNQTYGLW
eukprot:CAMPEP_0201552634 /NCGR_PEP_ID=MMETSP0173_2-20130828/16825_1 /ASSEMBLY_ACC=CAM_ASM_000268 /TAXON_ID=218659 /ORGANISM="Vexillifera sp., Strain DIVA3 564/2" /LENGTH=336 /DNA_ID=CAMNT_0047963141 /DNA_START=245 /DNA_END=1252 /DNA_ORIENTATION=+